MGPPREIWQAPAKINLWLTITDRRDDGWHSVDTALQAIDLWDTLVLEAAPANAPLTCRIEGPAAEGVPEGEWNLAARAARELAARTGHDLRLALAIAKEIPAGAGLGGGSSDAAAVLVALGKRFAVPDPETTLAGLALELGADVPFFLRGGTQRARGTGGELEPLPMPAERWGILAFPGVAVSTAWAYRAWDEAGTGGGREPGSARGNDFEPVVFARHPEIRALREAMAEGPAAVTKLSGSGSAIYSLYADPAERDRDLPRVTEALPSHRSARAWPFVCIDHGVRPVNLSGRKGNGNPFTSYLQAGTETA